jgi:dTDP-4-dehydrorhamnose reductase
MLGAAFHAIFSNGYEILASDIDVNEEWLTFCDFRDSAAYRNHVRNFRPDYLFHLGAHTDLEYCEENVDDAYLTNTISVENAVYIANELDIPILYISTAGIFDGRKDTYDDWDIPNPLGHYARSKFAAEVFVQSNCRRYLICRAGWMMGGGPRKDKKFVQKIMRQLKEGKQDLYIVNDRLGTPTYTYDFARNVRRLLESGYWGLYNMVCEGLTSRLDVAKEILCIVGLEKDVRIHEVSSDHFKKEYFAQRPPSERLTNRKLALRGLNDMSHWRVALREYLGDAYRGYL